jgi:hypothetical protein
VCVYVCVCVCVYAVNQKGEGHVTHAPVFFPFFFFAYRANTPTSYNIAAHNNSIADTTREGKRTHGDVVGVTSLFPANTRVNVSAHVLNILCLRYAMVMPLSLEGWTAIKPMCCVVLCGVVLPLCFVATASHGGTQAVLLRESGAALAWG